MKNQIPGDGESFIGVGMQGATVLGRLLDLAALTPFDYEGMTYKSVFAAALGEHYRSTKGGDPPAEYRNLYGEMAHRVWVALPEHHRAPLRLVIPEMWNQMAEQFYIPSRDCTLKVLLSQHDLPFQWIVDHEAQIVTALPEWIEAMFARAAGRRYIPRRHPTTV